MEEYLYSLRDKSDFNQDAYKVMNNQAVKYRFDITEKKFKTKIKNIVFGTKNYLNSMSENYPLLKNLISKLKKQKLKHQDNADVDVSDYTQVIKKHKTEKKIRKEVFELDQEEKNVEYLKELTDNKIKEIEEQKILQTKKREKLEILQIKAKARHEDLQKQKAQLLMTSFTKGKPKYVEMEQAYKVNVEIPELERIKAELTKKKNYFNRISREDWLIHARKYDDQILEAKKRREIKLHEYNMDNTVNSINIFKKNGKH
jgi:hypothetical protein